MIILFIGLGIFYPFVHSIIFIPSALLKPLVFCSFLLLVIYIITVKRKIELPDKQFSLIIFIQMIYFALYSFFFNSQIVAFYIFYAFGSWMVLLIIINTVGTDYFMSFFIRFNIIADFLLVAGLILVGLNIIGVYSVIEYSGKNLNNYLFFFMKQAEGIDDYSVIRAAGYYDEPGSLAYITMFLLLINHKYYKNKFTEKILLIFPILTTSLAHIVTAIAYCLLFKVSIKKAHKIVILITMGIIIFNAALKIETNNTVINTFLATTVHRIDNIFQGGEDASRKGGYSLGPQIFKKYQLGVSPETIENEYPLFVDETFWFPILAFGVIGVFIYFLPITYVTLKPLFYKHSKDTNEIKYIFLLLLNFGQRPHYIFPIYIFLIYILFFNKSMMIKSKVV
jgi:hypothetical protein